MLKNTPNGFGALSKWLHWVTAAAVFTLIPLGIYMHELPLSVEKLQLYGIHKSIGICVLAATLIRVLWWAANPVPEPLGARPAWEHRLARLVQAVLYLCLVGMPVSGWLMSSASNAPVSVFGLITLPDLVSPSEPAAKLWKTIHFATGVTLVAALALHIGGAIRHHLILKDDTLRRMLPDRRGS